MDFLVFHFINHMRNIVLHQKWLRDLVSLILKALKLHNFVYKCITEV